MFSWSNGSSTTTTRSNYPGRRNNNKNTATPIAGSIRPPASGSTSSGSGEITRAQHLQSYLEDSTLQRSTRRVSSDDTTYDTVFQTTGGDTLILRVNVPLQSSFAAFCPAMTLAGVRVRHPWVDSNNRMRIKGYPPIQSEKVWKEANIMLGDAVHAVVKHLQLNPPEILEITDKGLQNIQTNKKKYQNGKSNNNIKSPPRSGNNLNGSGTNRGGSVDDAPPSYNVVAEATPAPEVPMPTIPRKFPEVDGLSRQELDDLMDDELEFTAFVHKLPVYDKIYTIGSKRLNENVTLANENLEHEPKLKELQADIKRLQSTIQTKHEAFSKLEAQQNAICAPPDKAVTLKKLNKAKKEAFDASEEVAESWVEDGGSVDDFCKKFLETRTVHHMRAAKIEILKHEGQDIKGTHSF